jgi:hypothetical protein
MLLRISFSGTFTPGEEEVEYLVNEPDDVLTLKSIYTLARA